MNKLLLLVIAIITIPLVQALTIFGEEVSMLVLTPVIFIVFFLVIFIVMIVRDKLKDKTKKPEFSEDLEPPAGDPLELEPLPEEEAPPVDKTPVPEAKKDSGKVESEKPKKDYSKEIEDIRVKLSSENIEETNKELNDLIKKFFAEYAGINYKFTFKELEKELKKRDNKVACFSENLCKINYSPEGASEQDIHELMDEFKDIIEAVKEEEKQAIPKFKKETEEKKKKINLLLKKSEKLIGKDINQARENYNEIISIYKTLILVEKATVRPLIMNFYNKLNN